MKIGKKFKSFVILMTFIFFIQFTFFSSNTFSQSIEQANDRIGGSGTTSSSDDSSNSNTILYILAGAIVVGLIVWKVFIDKKKPKTEDNEQSDSTKLSLNNPHYKNQLGTEIEVEKIRNQLPIEIFFESKENFLNLPSRNLSIGVKLKL
jgi:hypothetical protein